MSEHAMKPRLRGHAEEQRDIRPTDRPSYLACTLACRHTSILIPVRASVPPEILPGAFPDSSADEHISCRKGFSAAQINIIGLLLSLGPAVTPYKSLSFELERVYAMRRSPGAVRRSIERLMHRGVLRRRQAREGMTQGVAIHLNQDFLCPHIYPAALCMRPCVPPGNHPHASPDSRPSSISILEKKERKNLSIYSEKSVIHRELLEALEEEDIAFHWPELARAGFGTVQIRQIIERRAQVGATLEYVMQGLTYAEWELANRGMRTQKGEPVANPLNWVFKILATQGYYPRPADYVSPGEHAARDQEQTAHREKIALEALFQAEFEAWAAGLAPATRRAILGPDQGERAVIPETVRLRTHFRESVWPKRQRPPDSPNGSAERARERSL